MSGIGEAFCQDLLDALNKDMLSIMLGDTTSELFSPWVLKHGLDHHEFAIAELGDMDEDERMDSQKFMIRRLAGKRAR
jgi:hypothetical protein